MTILRTGLWGAILGLQAALAFAAGNLSPVIVSPEKAPIIAAAQVGKRTVAVGDYGAVIISDDGKHFRQAKNVPTRTVLTSIFILDDRQAWAVGHDGTVIASSDGGETWILQHEEAGKDRVLLSVWFENSLHGMAVGQFGLALETEDGGKTWQERRLIDGEAGERHLLGMFSGDHGQLFIAAEAGAILRSEDSGRHWNLIQTDNKGSFWVGRRLRDGVLIAAGMRGHVYRSTDHGKSWVESPWVSQQSISVVLEQGSGEILLLGSSGVIIQSQDAGMTLRAKARADRANITAAVRAGDRVLLFTRGGVLSDKE